MRPRFDELFRHLARIALFSAALAFAGRSGSALFAALASGALFFSAFAMMHDAAHGALRLPRWANELALSASGAAMLMSGHALRRSHIRHHARCLADDDHEGAPARGSLARALVSAPIHAVSLRARAFAMARGRGRLWQLAEGAANAASLAAIAAWAGPAIRAYAAVAIAGQLSMALWAAYIPHNAPAWLIRGAARVARLGGPVAMSLAYHDLHHARPQIPCARLAEVAGA